MSPENIEEMNNDDAWETAQEAFNMEVAVHLENQLQKALNDFRQDLRAHPYVRRREGHGFSLMRKLAFSSSPWARSFLLAGTGLAVVVLVGFLILGSNPPTWAEIAESFRRADSYYATYYMKSCDWCSPSRVEFWRGSGGRYRILSEDIVAFGIKDEHLKAYNVKDRAESEPDPNMLTVLWHIDAIEETKTSFIESFFEAHSDGDVVDTTALVHPDPIFSRDLVVFDAKSSGGYASIRLWALRESRLPIRILYRGQAGFYVDVIIVYSKLQPERFFDPEAFATEMNKSYHMEDDLRYLFMEDPAETAK